MEQTMVIMGQMPATIFLQDALHRDAKKLLLLYCKEYVLHGISHFIDKNDGSETLLKIDKKNCFAMPTMPFIDFEMKRINIDELLVYSYLCYVAYTAKTSLIKIRLDMISKRTSLPKKAIKDVLNSLYEKEIYLEQAAKGLVNVKLCDENLLSDLDRL